MNDSAAYSKGYHAGRKRLAKDEREGELWRSAVVAAIDFAFTQDSWTRGQERISSVADRAKLAANIADAVVAEARARGRL